MPHHLDGREENNAPSNLLLVCRRCNGLAAFAHRRAGIGRRTAQYNPVQDGAQTLAEWIEAARVATGQIHPASMPLDRAISVVQKTPADRRSEFAKEIWQLRREHGTAYPSRRTLDEVPF